ncbi:hypothetical protein [Nocardioides sp.]|uniref:hypothetical protein n=1 Tax=Nocardioides sp. TaxID=35761 RepID=UPI0026131BDA|nr:hypothetical protein [Nocardioides sp.]MDI6909544.1 hypothetical protein [Nocardioides sp.]
MTPSTSTASLRRAVVIGAVAGVIASVVMAMYAMLAAYTKDTGFFTPMYHIASLLTDDADMMRSMMADQQSGDAFTFLAGPATLGAVIHMMTGAAYGAVFGVLANRLRLGGVVLAGIGVVYGFVVFALSAYVVLPIAAAMFDSGDPIENMAEMAGWGTFIIEHLIYGAVLGLLVTGAARTRTAAASTPVHAH